MPEYWNNIRIQHLHSTEDEWSNIENTFIPEAGEIIIYDADDTYDHPRLKIGDGESVLSALPLMMRCCLTPDVYVTTPNNRLQVTTHAPVESWAEELYVESTKLSDVHVPLQKLPFNSTIQLENLSNYLYDNNKIDLEFVTTRATRIPSPPKRYSKVQPATSYFAPGDWTFTPLQTTDASRTFSDTCSSKILVYGAGLVGDSHYDVMPCTITKDSEKVEITGDVLGWSATYTFREDGGGPWITYPGNGMSIKYDYTYISGDSLCSTNNSTDLYYYCLACCYKDITADDPIVGMWSINSESVTFSGLSNIKDLIGSRSFNLDVDNESEIRVDTSDKFYYTYKGYSYELNEEGSPKTFTVIPGKQISQYLYKWIFSNCTKIN